MSHRPEGQLHFLLVYDLRQRRLLRAERYSDADEAAVAYGQAEREHLKDRGVEIVLVGADSLETIKSTHGHYFANGEPTLVLPELAAT